MHTSNGGIGGGIGAGGASVAGGPSKLTSKRLGIYRLKSKVQITYLLEET